MTYVGISRVSRLTVPMAAASWVCLAGLMVWSGGCSFIDEPIKVVSASPAGGTGGAGGGGAGQIAASERSGEAAKGRFEPAGSAKSGLEDAIAVSQKYQQLIEKYEKLAEENSTGKVEIEQLKLKNAALAAEVGQLQAELADANKFMQDMQAELVKWKGDVLGFRREMQKAQEAQLAALNKILRLLGAEPEEVPSAKEKPGDSREAAGEAQDKGIKDREVKR